MCSVGVSTENTDTVCTALTATGTGITLYQCLLKHCLHCTGDHWNWHYTDTDVHWSGDFSDEKLKINANQYGNVNVSVRFSVSVITAPVNVGVSASSVSVNTDTV
jgi:hypothetical protein